MLANGDYGYECALPPSDFCILSEEKGDTLNFYALDPKRGPAAKPLLSTNNVSDWSLSPDGQQIALVRNDKKGQIQILGLSNGSVRSLDIGKWTQLQTVGWSPDGRVLYVTSFALSGTTLLSVTLDGRASVLFQQGHNWLCCPKVAPNGRLLAFSVTEIERDAAMIESF